jgi:hypothetical protein
VRRTSEVVSRCNLLAVSLKPVLLATVGLLLVSGGAAAQVYWQPQPAPLVTAENESWFRLGEPITFEGYIYYPAGARVFFDGNVMVRSGAFRGIPIYTDTTIEAYSRVLVPVSGGMLQPYERRRTGDAAGTTGSRAPSFPVTMAGEPSEEPTLTGTTGEAPVAAASTGVAPSPAAAASAPGEVVRPRRTLVEAGLRPKGLNEIYVVYSGYRWRAAGKAVPMDGARYQPIGRYRGYLVYADRAELESPRVIYLPSRPGLIAPYERAGKPPRY